MKYKDGDRVRVIARALDTWPPRGSVGTVVGTGVIYAYVRFDKYPHVGRFNFGWPYSTMDIEPFTTCIFGGGV